nr:putative capsid [Marmot picobirnavirus]
MYLEEIFMAKFIKDKDKRSTGYTNDDHKTSGMPLVTKKKRPCWSAKGESNDAGWFKDPRGIVSSAAKIPTYLPLGKGYIPLISGETPTTGIPIIMTCEWLPVPGISNSNTSGISLSGNILFQQIRKVLNKPVAGYHFADPIIVYTCMLSIMALVEEIKRDYGIVNSYNTLNVGYPNLILRSFGYNESAIIDLKQHLANYRNEFNSLMYELSTVYAPIETNIGEKFKWLSRHIWMDHDSAKAQLYAYTLGGYYEYSDTASTEGSAALFVRWTHAERMKENRLFGIKLNILRDMIREIRSSDSYNSMLSDMERAFGDAASYTWEDLTEDYVVKPVINDVMLNQFQNIITAPAIDWSGNAAELFNITQDVTNNTILCQPNNVPIKADISVGINMFDPLEDIIKDYGIPTNFTSPTPSEDDVIENLNAKVLFRYDKGNNTFTFREDSISCYIPIGFITVVPRGNDTGNADVLELNTYMTPQNAEEVTEVNQILTSLWVTHAFDWCPMIYWLNEDVFSKPILQPFVESDNLIYVSVKDFTLMNYGEQMALWRVPEDIIQGVVR